MTNIITAQFTPGITSARVSGVWQWDYGQVLRIQGLSLPTAVEVHFAPEGSPETITRVGVTRDGVTDVPVPDSILERAGTACAYVYLADAASGNTEYKVTMRIMDRPRPEAFDAPGDAELFREAIDAVNTSAERAETAADKAEGAALAVAPEIGPDGNWIIMGNDTGRPSRGDPATTEQVSQAVNDYLSKNPVQPGGVMPRICCWGDSLTVGAGGDVSGWHVVDYPKVLADLSGCPVVNLGVSGEDSIAISARQGADPLVTGAITIPADKTPVQLGTYTDGLRTKSGRVCKPLYQGNAGVNPCYINGIKGTLYASSRTDTAAMTYYFVRDAAGTETAVPAGTVIETFAMQNYRGGIGIIWMGANGGWTSADDLASQVQNMITYGGYDDYLVVLLRETVDVSAFETAFGNRFIHLLQLLKDQGLAEAAINADGGEMTNGIPAQLDSGDGLHLNFYGYQAVGKFIYRRLMELGMLEPGAAEKPSDEYGPLLYKLPAPKTLNGKNEIINTKAKLYDDKDKNWTVVCVYDGQIVSSQGLPYILLSCGYDGAKGLQVRYIGANEPVTIGAGSGGIRVDYAGCTENIGGKNVLTIVKDGDKYGIWLNGTLAYGAQLGYPIETADQHDVMLIAGARYNATGKLEYYTSSTIRDLRVYDTALSDSNVGLLTAELA